MEEKKQITNKEAGAPEEEAGESMSFWDHLEVLRWAIFRIACFLCVCMVGTFIAMPYIFDNYILAPTSNNFFVYQWLQKHGHGLIQMNPDFSVEIININVASQFMTHITTSLYLGLLGASPFIVFELFRFVSPALYDNEKRYSVQVVVIVYLLFILGVLMSYYVLFPISFRFLGTYSVAERVHSTITLDSYISTFTTLTLLMGVVFQLPVIAFALAKLGFISSEILSKYRKHSFLIIMLVAAIITPPDLMTLVLVTIPLYLLYEVSIRVTRWVGKVH